MSEKGEFQDRKEKPIVNVCPSGKLNSDEVRGLFDQSTIARLTLFSRCPRLRKYAELKDEWMQSKRDTRE